MPGGFLQFCMHTWDTHLFTFFSSFSATNERVLREPFQPSAICCCYLVHVIICSVKQNQTRWQTRQNDQLHSDLDSANRLINAKAPWHVAACIYQCELFVQVLIEMNEKVKQWGESLPLDSSWWQSHSRSAAAEQVSRINGQEKERWQTVHASSFHAIQCWTTTACFFPLNFAFGELWGAAPNKE